jgi:ammonia channel protein AmtB
MILTSLFTTVTANSAAIDGAFYGNWVELGKCLLVLVILVPWVFAATWACLFITDKLITLRVSGETQNE